MPLCAHNCGRGRGGLFVTPIEVCVHPSAFLSMARKTYSWWLFIYKEFHFEFGRVGVHQLQNTLLVFHCLISVAAHTTCCRNVNFLILFWWYSTLIYSFDAKLSYAAGLPMSPLLQGHFLWEILPQRQTNKSKKRNQKKGKKKQQQY